MDVRDVLMLLRKPGLRPGFSGIDDDTIAPFLSPALYFPLCSSFSYLPQGDHSNCCRSIFYIYGWPMVKYFICLCSTGNAFLNCGNKVKTVMREGDEFTPTVSIILAIEHLLAGNEFRPLPHSCLSSPGNF